MCSKVLSLAVLALVTSIPYLVQGSNILFFFGVASYSHRVAVWPLVEALADKGHNVTFFFLHKPRNPHPKVLEFGHQIENYAARVGLADIDTVNVRLNYGRDSVTQLWPNLTEVGVKTCQVLLTEPQGKEWIRSSSFDLIVIDALFNDCALGLAHIFRAPFIIYGTTAPFMWLHDAFGYPDETAYNPDIQIGYPFPMSFWNRVKNALRPIGWHFYKRWFMFPRLEKLFKEELGIEDLPFLYDLERNASLIFTHRHATEDLARSLPPLFVPIGGMHIKETSKPLPKEIEEFIQRGKHGFIYVSYGSMANTESLTNKAKNSLLTAFARMKNIQFLWKYDGQVSENLPSNILVSPWLSQQDVLAHKNIKAFISHGGALSRQEALYYGVPMINMPIFAEQDFNSNVAHFKKFAIAVDINNFSAEELEAAVMQLLTNPVYKETVVKTSKLFKDRPMKPLQTAVWWTEYILRNSDTSHLRSLGMALTWYERRQIDVWLFIIFCSMIVTLLPFYGIIKLALLFKNNTRRDHDSSKITKKKL